jgi:hypothetical protein
MSAAPQRAASDGGGALAPLASVPEGERAAFGEAVKGEWVGFEADFDPDTGAALTVPNYYIPEEFEQWGLLPVGFET